LQNILVRNITGITTPVTSTVHEATTLKHLYKLTRHPAFDQHDLDIHFAHNLHTHFNYETSG